MREVLKVIEKKGKFEKDFSFCYYKKEIKMVKKVLNNFKKVLKLKKKQIARY
jgi:hypothetical protein